MSTFGMPAAVEAVEAVEAADSAPAPPSPGGGAGRAKRVALPLLLAAMVTAGSSVIPAGTAVAAPTGGNHCVVNTENGSTTCFGGFQDAVSFATDGRVTDAPDATTAATSEQFAQRLNQKPASGTKAVVAITYSGQKFDGDTLIVVAGSPCTANNGVSAQLANLGRVPYNSGGASWNDRINSYVGFNQCQTKAFLDVDFKGYQGDAVPTGDTGTTPLHGGVSSLQFFYRPGDMDVLGLCEGGADCTFNPLKSSVVTGPPTLVELAWNCTGQAQSTTVNWTKTFSSSNTVGVEVGVTLGFDLLQKFEASVKASYQHNWSESTTFGQSTPINVPARSVGMLSITPQTETVIGLFNVSPKNQYYGSSHYYPSLTATQTVKTEAVPVVWNERPMTGDEKAAYCGGGGGTRGTLGTRTFGVTVRP
ncbi:hypothetical protein ACFXPI_34475 [Streptomyces sp. NPDC059104]|uniref:hypothetical protein n=1 Tax=Streptomyces sp. NPDC059104 TaxID=3346729 RepID=UPI0036ACB2AF